MQTIVRDGATLHFTERGSGPAVILQHALSADARSWSAIAIAEALVSKGFRVILPDALGHGRSSVAGVDRVGLSSRVQDLLAVADALDLDRFHYAGYSMGGWLGIGLLRDAPERLLSLAIAGWDPIDGARRFTEHVETGERRREFVDRVKALMGQTSARTQTEEVRMIGYADTYERLFSDVPSITTLIEHDVPIMIGIGRDDPYREPAAAAADVIDVNLVEIPGDHVTAFFDPTYASSLIAWLSTHTL